VQADPPVQLGQVQTPQVIERDLGLGMPSGGGGGGWGRGG
jgi:hypothetical protein